MKKSLKRLWNDFLSEECAQMNTEGEQVLTKQCFAAHEKLNNMLNKEQELALEEYIDTVYDLEAAFAQKAFIKGCEFATAFLLEAGNMEK